MINNNNNNINSVVNFLFKFFTGLVTFSFSIFVIAQLFPRNLFSFIILLVLFIAFFYYSFRLIFNSFLTSTDFSRRRGKALFLFKVMFGIFGFFSINICVSAFSPLSKIPAFSVFFWFIYIFSNFFFSSKNPLIRFISFLGFAITVGAIINFLSGLLNNSNILVNGFKNGIGTTDYYYTDTDDNRYWIINLYTILDYYAGTFKRFINSGYNYKFLMSEDTGLSYSGTLQVSSATAVNQIASAVFLAFILVFAYFFFKTVFFRFIYANVERLTTYSKFRDFQAYFFYFFSLFILFFSLPYFFQFVLDYSSFRLITRFVSHVFELCNEAFVHPLSEFMDDIYSSFLDEHVKGARSTRSGLQFNLWLQFWIQLTIFYFNPWMNHTISYLFDTTFLFDYDRTLSYKRITSWYRAFLYFLRFSERLIPRSFLPWRLANKSAHIYFEDERDKYIRQWPFIGHIFHYRKHDFYTSDYYLDKLDFYKIKFSSFFSTHLKTLREQEAFWRTELNFFYKVGIEADLNIAPSFFANTHVYKPLINIASKEFRSVLEMVDLPEEIDEMEDPDLDIRFENNFIGQGYYHNYKVIKYFDWVNVSDKKFVTEVSDTVSFYSKFWYSNFMISQFGKTFVTPKEYEYRKFLNSSYYPYIESRTISNYYKGSILDQSLILNYNNLSFYSFFPNLHYETPQCLYEYINLNTINFRFFDNLVQNISGVGINTKSTNPQLILRFIYIFEEFIIEFLLDALFSDLYKTYGIDDLENKTSYMVPEKLDNASPASRFMKFALRLGFLDFIYIAFFNGVFFNEFFYYFNKYISYTYTDSQAYVNSMIKFYSSQVLKSFSNAGSVNDLSLQNFFIFAGLNFEVLDFELFEYTSINNLHPADFPTDYLSVFLVPIKSDFSISRFKVFELKDVEASPQGFKTFDESSNVTNFSLDFASSVRTARECITDLETATSEIFAVSKAANFIDFSQSSFFQAFTSEWMNAYAISESVFDSIYFNEFFPVLHTPKKLKIDLLSKQLDTLFGLKITGYETFPRFVGFASSDLVINSLFENKSSAYSDFNLCSSFEEYYNYSHFSDYRNFYASNFLVNPNPLTLISFDSFLFTYSLYRNSFLRGSSDLVRYIDSVLFFSKSIVNNISVVNSPYVSHARDAWCLNYSFMFSTVVSASYWKLHSRSFISNYSVINENFAFSHSVFVFESKSTHKFWYYARLCYFNWFLFDFMKLFTSTYYLNSFFGRLLVRLVFLLFSRFTRYIKYGLFLLRSVFRVKRSLFIPNSKENFHFRYESESNFDFNDRVFSFFAEVSSYSTGHFNRFTNFSVFAYSSEFFSNYFKKK